MSRRWSEERKRAERELKDLLKHVNDPEVFRRAASEDDADFEAINLAHDRLVRKSKAALVTRGARRR